MTIPAIPRSERRSPPGSTISSPVIHRGTVATTNEANPEGTVFSARITNPLPPTNNRSPAATRVVKSRPEARMGRRRPTNPSSISIPAVR